MEMGCTGEHLISLPVQASLLQPHQLPLDDSNWAQPHCLFRYPRVVANVHHIIDILVALWRLFRHQLGRCNTYGNSLGLEVGQHLGIFQLLPTAAATDGAPGPMACTPKRLLHALFRACGCDALGTWDHKL